MARGDRGRTIKLSDRAMRAIVRWDRVRTRALGEPGPGHALFVTLGRRKADGSYADVGRRWGQPVLAAVIKHLGAAANLPPGLCHPYALRHTCATGLLRTGATIADVRTMLGHASIKTTSIYLASHEQRQEDAVAQRQRGGRVRDEDRDSRA
jgi:site-specific recombinase XerD